MYADTFSHQGPGQLTLMSTLFCWWGFMMKGVDTEQCDRARGECRSQRGYLKQDTL